MQTCIQAVCTVTHRHTQLGATCSLLLACCFVLYQVVPWAVTANVALVNTSHQFDLRFPKTGGGEDIDYCLKVTGGGLVPVPQVRICNASHCCW